MSHQIHVFSMGKALLDFSTTAFMSSLQILHAAVKPIPGVGFYPTKHLFPTRIPAANERYKYIPVSTTSTNAIYSTKRASALSFNDFKTSLSKGEALKKLEAFRVHVITGIYIHCMDKPSSHSVPVCPHKHISVELIPRKDFPDFSSQSCIRGFGTPLSMHLCGHFSWPEMTPKRSTSGVEL